jgi:CRISPR-associated protein Cas1
MGVSDPSQFGDELVQARALNEYVYCPRLHYLMYVQGAWSPSADTVEGAAQHRRAASRRANGESTAPQGATEETLPWQRPREFYIGDEALGVVAKLDAVREEGGELVPVEAKHGWSPRGSEGYECEGHQLQGGAWPGDQVQLCAQGLLLRTRGFLSDYGILYYRKTRTSVKVPFTDSLVQATYQIIHRAHKARRAGMPCPLTNSPKCERCSLNHICMPDETTLLQRASVEPPRRIVPGRPDGGVLYLTTQGSRLRVRQDSLVIESEETQDTVLIKDTADVAIFGNVQVTTQTLNHLMRQGRTVAFHTLGGWLHGLAMPLFTQNVHLRRLQFQRFADEATALPLARRIVEAKVLNQRTLLRRNAEVSAETLNALRDSATAATRAESVESLLGYEGSAARLYFETFGTAIREPLREAFAIDGRNRRPPRDAVNALLSFGYALLTRELVAITARVGFDPMYGFFHALRPGRPALALDIMEPYRPLIADSLALRVVNTREIQEDDFDSVVGGVSLSAKGRKKYLIAYERRMNQEVTHPLFGYRISYRRTLELETRILARVLEGELEEIHPLVTR